MRIDFQGANEHDRNIYSNHVHGKFIEQVEQEGTVHAVGKTQAHFDNASHNFKKTTHTHKYITVRNTITNVQQKTEAKRNCSIHNTTKFIGTQKKLNEKFILVLTF